MSGIFVCYEYIDDVIVFGFSVLLKIDGNDIVFVFYYMGLM